MSEYVIEKRVIVRVHAFEGLTLEVPPAPRSRQVCYVCKVQLPDEGVRQVTVSCRRCGSQWSAKATETCGEECAELYATYAELEAHRTRGERGSTCSLPAPDHEPCRGGCGRLVPTAQKCFDCASQAVTEWVRRGALLRTRVRQ